MENKKIDNEDIFNLFSGNLFSENTVIGKYLNHIKNLNKIMSDKFRNVYQPIIMDHKSDYNKIFLSVIIRTQGKRIEGLREAFLCLEAQTDQDFEVILVAHNANESGLKNINIILEELNHTLKNKIHFIIVNEGTRATPINYGFAHAIGTYAAIFDDDDILFDNWVESFHKALAEGNNRLLHAYTFSQKWQITDSGYCAISAPIDNFCLPFDLVRQMNVNKCPLMSIAFPCYLFRDNGICFDETLDVTEDWEYIMRVAPLCGVYDIDVPTSIYRLWSNLENSAKIHDQDKWDELYYSIRKKMNSVPLLLPEGFMRSENNASGGNTLCSVGFPRMVGILFCDLGNGFTDDHLMIDDSYQMLPQFNFNFILHDEFRKSVKFRVDPCEYGGIVISNLEITMIGTDGTEKIIILKDCWHNGVKDGEKVFFLHYDPQISWENQREISEIRIKGNLTMEAPEEMIQKAINESNVNKDNGLFIRARRLCGRLYRKIVKK